jgi:hypothetical protein
MADQVTDRAGKPVNTGDGVTIVGTVTSTSSTGPSANVVVKLAGSGNTVTVQAQDVAASTQTL